MVLVWEAGVMVVAARREEEGWGERGAVGLREELGEGEVGAGVVRNTRS